MGNKENKATERDSQPIEKWPGINEGKGGLTPKGEELAARVRKLFEDRQRRFQAMTYPCPIDGKLSGYSGMTGTYQIVVPVFQCPDGHKFSVRTIGQTNVPKLLPRKEI